jgi:hypothetical protein
MLIDCRIARRIAGRQKIAIFDEQQAVDDQRRDRGEIAIDPLRLPPPVV